MMIVWLHSQLCRPSSFLPCFCRCFQFTFSNCAVSNLCLKILNGKDKGCVSGGSGNLERVRRGRALGEEVASVKPRRTHNLHGNSLIFLSVAVRPAGHMVTEWTGCADDQRWGGELGRGGEEYAWIRDSGLCLPSLSPSLSFALFFPPLKLCHLQTPRTALIGLAMN